LEKARGGAGAETSGDVSLVRGADHTGKRWQEKEERGKTETQEGGRLGEADLDTISDESKGKTSHSGKTRKKRRQGRCGHKCPGESD